MAGQAQGGEVVAWRCRVVAPNGNKGKWVLTDEPSVSGGCIEVEPLYSRPPTPSAPVGLVAKWRERMDASDHFNIKGSYTLRQCAEELEAALAQQPAAVDGVCDHEFTQCCDMSLPQTFELVCRKCGASADRRPAAVDGAK